jgi:hypothetical protein
LNGGNDLLPVQVIELYGLQAHYDPWMLPT